MKLLFDENLSPRLAPSLADLFPGSTHVRDVQLRSAEDPTVWDYARTNGFLIVSRDAVMHDLSLLFGNPPERHPENLKLRLEIMLLRSD